MDLNYTFFGQLVSFAILVWFTMKFIWPPLNGAIEARQKTIADGLAAADRSHHELQSTQQTIEGMLREARASANQVIEQANQRGTQIIEQAKQDAMVEATRLRAMADAEILASTNRAREDLRNQVSMLAVAGAEKLLQREIDLEAHKALIDDLASQL